MALSGTLKDFGIADILQLIGQQAKTGVLLLRTGSDQVEVSFIDGTVVFATERLRRQQAFLGNMLVRAHLITEEQLEQALQQQSRSLRRLGDVLIELRFVTEAQLGQMARLQTTETLYKLFRWKSGTYEFNQSEVEAGRLSFEPIRAETILLEGFRRMDEWPAIRKRVPQETDILERSQELDTRDAPTLDEVRPELEGHGEGEDKPGWRHKVVYRLIDGELTLVQVAERSRLGEFEAYKAIAQLLDWGYLRLKPAARGTAAAMRDLAAGGRRFAASGALVRYLIALAVFVSTLYWLGHLESLSGAGLRLDLPARRGATARLLSRTQQARIEGALEVFRDQHGVYPDRLEQLVEEDILAKGDLTHPFHRPYSYRRTAQGFVLLPPLD